MTGYPESEKGSILKKTQRILGQAAKVWRLVKAVAISHVRKKGLAKRKKQGLARGG